MPVPRKCKAAVANHKGAKLKIVEIDVPKPREGEILIKVHACGVCHSDVMAVEGGMGDLNWPLIPGHETVGTVVGVGAGVKNWKEGELAGGAWCGGWDGTCRSCMRGLFQMCENGTVNGVFRVGGYAEYTTLRAEAAVRLPSNVDMAKMAPLLCAGVTVFNGIRNMKIPAGGTVAIQGLGGLGHLAVQYSRKLGYRTIALSSNATKRDFALNQLGATDYVDGSSEDAVAAVQRMGGADLVVSTAPSPKVVPSLVNMIAPRGTLLLLSAVGDVSISTIPLILKGITVCGWPSGHALDSREAVDFARRNGVECMIEKFPLEKAQDAIDHMLSGNVRFRGVLVMD